MVTKLDRFNIIILSDTHAGSKLALCNPDVVIQRPITEVDETGITQQPKESIDYPRDIERHFNLLIDIISRLDLLIKNQKMRNDRKEQYLVPTQVCELLSINRSTFERYVDSGIFRIYRLGKGKIYCKRSEIDTLFNS